MRWLHYQAASLVSFASLLGAQDAVPVPLPLQLRDAVRATCGWREAQQDRSVLGEALQLGDVAADVGIGTHAPAELVWKVPAGQRWLGMWFGIANERGHSGSVVLQVSCDGEVVFNSPVQRGGDAPLWVAVPVNGARELRLVITDGGDGNGSDHVNLLFPSWFPSEATPVPVRAPATTFVGAAAGPGKELALWSRLPAKAFVEAFPLGDGRLGAVWFGGVGSDRIVLNEISMWSGSPQDADRAEASQHLPAIVALLREGKYGEAEQLVNRTFTCQGAGSGGGNGKDVPFGCYQTLGDLEVTVFDRDGQPLAGEVRDYERVLLLGPAAEQRVRFTDRYGRHHVRRLTCDGGVGLKLNAGGEPLDVRIALRRREQATVVVEGSNRLVLRGALADGKGGEGVQFQAIVAVSAGDGEVRAEGQAVRVVGAKDIQIGIAARTSFPGLRGERGDVARDFSRRRPVSTPTRESGVVMGPPFQLELQDVPSRAQPTLDRLVALAGGRRDQDLFALYLAYADHLLCSSSREGGLPANLQGLWAPEYQTPWNGDYHLNVNVQMNYWAALPTGRFAEHLPLVDLIESLVPNGTKTARAYYGAPGWVAHTITNVWGYTSPGEQASWGASTSSGWLCRHLHEHWAFTQDRAFLQRVYPTLREAARFYRHLLVPHGPDGTLVTPVSNSPENAFRTADGQTASVCMGPTIDQQIVRELFANVVEAATVLGVDADLVADLAATKAKLAPHRIGKHGQLQEWLIDHDEPEPHHRHVSHLYGLYPGDQITPFGTPELARAARVTLERRGDDGTGWSLAFKANLWARLGDGDRALAVLTKLLRPVGVPGFEGGHGGSYANLFCAHPPFQIDGNFGGAAAIVELLLQSHRERAGEDFTIHLLPALPRAWHHGRVHGLRARGNFVLEELAWREGALLSASVRNANSVPRSLRLRVPGATALRIDGALVAVLDTAGVRVLELPANGRVQVAAAR